MNTSLSGDLNLYGVFVPTPLVLMAVAYLLKGAIRGVLARVGFYGRIWHPGLFNVALYIVVLGSMLALVPGVQP